MGLEGIWGIKKFHWYFSLHCWALDGKWVRCILFVGGSCASSSRSMVAKYFPQRSKANRSVLSTSCSSHFLPAGIQVIPFLWYIYIYICVCESICLCIITCVYMHACIFVCIAVGTSRRGENPQKKRILWCQKALIEIRGCLMEGNVGVDNHKRESSILSKGNLAPQN